MALRNIDGSRVKIRQLHTPTVNNSDLPGLLGLSALRRNRAVLDFNTLQLHLCGLGSYNLETGLPPGTESFQCEIAPSGHIVLPCCEYEAAPSRDEHTLTLVSQQEQPSQQAAAAERSTPPPPCFSPRLPIIAPPFWPTATTPEANSQLYSSVGRTPSAVQAVAGSRPTGLHNWLVASLPCSLASSSDAESS